MGRVLLQAPCMQMDVVVPQAWLHEVLRADLKWRHALFGSSKFAVRLLEEAWSLGGPPHVHERGLAQGG